jgi:glutamate-5-semialdehyde dehydrogenase
MMDLLSSARLAKKASIELLVAETAMKNRALKAIQDELTLKKNEIIIANQEDILRSEQENLALPMLKRLCFDEKKLCEVIDGIESLITLPDPVGTVLYAKELDVGLDLYRVSCPIGVMGIIFESRPDALVQISTLCLKSGNAVLLKGGREALKTNRILFEIIKKASIEAGMPEGWIHLMESREDVNEMLKLDEFVDLIIPRG